jgi:positive regulator of sigma E activity
MASVDKSDSTVVWSITSPVGTEDEDMAVMYCNNNYCSNCSAKKEEGSNAMSCTRQKIARAPVEQQITVKVGNHIERDRW